jgi:hypothetical protein
MKLSHTVGLLSNTYGGGASVEDQGTTRSDSGASCYYHAQSDRGLCLGVHASIANFGLCALL